MSAKIETLNSRPARGNQIDLQPIVDELRQSRDVTHNIRKGGKVRELPSSIAILNVLEGLATSLFPTHLGPNGLKFDAVDLFVTNTLSTTLTRLADQITRGLQFNAETLSHRDARRQAEAIAGKFAQKLPEIRSLLVSDLQAAQRHDPSAESPSEVLICYRSSTAIIYHRLAHALHELGARLVARMISELGHASTGIDIHPGASIGPGFFISRGTGVVIGETAVIGQNVCLHQGVTLGESEPADTGANGKRKDGPRHPVLENNVVIYAGATLLGRITIGAGSIIYGNVWLTHSVAPGSLVRQAQALHAGIQIFS